MRFADGAAVDCTRAVVTVLRKTAYVAVDGWTLEPTDDGWHWFGIPDSELQRDGGAACFRIACGDDCVRVQVDIMRRGAGFSAR